MDNVEFLIHPVCNRQ